MRKTYELKRNQTTAGTYFVEDGKSFYDLRDEGIGIALCEPKTKIVFPQVTFSDNVTLVVSTTRMRKKGEKKVTEPVSQYGHGRIRAYMHVLGSDVEVTTSTKKQVAQDFPGVKTFYVNVVKVS